MLRAGRFRHRLLDDDFLKTLSPLASKALQPFLALWKQRILDEAEMAAIYILIFAFLRRPKDFLGGPHSEHLAFSPKENAFPAKEVVQIFRDQLPTPLKEAKSLARLEQESSFINTFCQLSWRSIPLSVPRSLCAWQAGQYPLVLLTHVPTPDEVMDLQAQGRRCVSMLTRPSELENFVEEGRDVLGFIVHDLIHADHFFADPQKAAAQIQFSQKLLRVRGLPPIQDMLGKDDLFQKEFHYLASDMNSVPLHLLKTLKAILLGHFKRQQGLPMASALPIQIEKDFHTLFETVLTPWNFSPEALLAAHRLNSPQYHGPSDAALLDLALSQISHDEPHVFC